MLEIGFIQDQRRVFDLGQLEQELVVLIEEFYGIVFFPRVGQGEVDITVFAGEYMCGYPVYFLGNEWFDKQAVPIDKDERIPGAG